MPETIKQEAKITLVKNKKSGKDAGNITIRNQKLLAYAGRKATVTIELDDIVAGVDAPTTPVEPEKANPTEESSILPDNLEDIQPPSIKEIIGVQ